MALKNTRISKLEAEVGKLTRVLSTNQDAKSRLALENQIIKLATERQTFFNYKFDLETNLQEKEDMLEEKNLQVQMMKGQIKILSKEIDEVKKKSVNKSLIPKKNIVKKIRGGGKLIKFFKSENILTFQVTKIRIKKRLQEVEDRETCRRMIFL